MIRGMRGAVGGIVRARGAVVYRKPGTCCVASGCAWWMRDGWVGAWAVVESVTVLCVVWYLEIIALFDKRIDWAGSAQVRYDPKISAMRGVCVNRPCSASLLQ